MTEVEVSECVTAGRTVPPVAGDEVQSAEVAEQLSAVLAGISEAPDSTADPLHVAYLRGAVDALGLAAGTSESDCPDPNESGHDDRDGSASRSAQDG